MVLPVTKRLDGLIKGPQDQKDDIQSSEYKDIPKKLNQLINKMTNELLQKHHNVRIKPVVKRA